MGCVGQKKDRDETVAHQNQLIIKKQLATDTQPPKKNVSTKNRQSHSIKSIPVANLSIDHDQIQRQKREHSALQQQKQKRRRELLLKQQRASKQQLAQRVTEKQAKQIAEQQQKRRAAEYQREQQQLRLNKIRQSYKINLEQKIPEISKIQTVSYEKLLVHNPITLGSA